MYTMSQKSASVAPMPMASPLTAAIIGWRTERMLRAVATASISKPGCPSGYDSFSFITEKSAPTVKYLPAPVSTITSTSSSAATFWYRNGSSECITVSSAFRRSGRFSVTTSTPSSSSVRMVLSPYRSAMTSGSLLRQPRAPEGCCHLVELGDERSRQRDAVAQPRRSALRLDLSGHEDAFGARRQRRLVTVAHE